VPDTLAIIAGKDEFLVEEDALRLYKEALKKAGSDADTQIVQAQITAGRRGRTN
jgi:hypothetical protein